MGPKMPCHISDGPQTPEDQAELNERFAPEDEDEAYERKRQEEIDDAYDPTPWCTWCGAKDSDQCTCGPIADNH